MIGHYTNFWPLLNLTFYLIVQGFHRTYATGAACQQRTLTPPDTWSCPTLGLACVLMSRPISPELFLSPDLWISNTPRYFSFAPLNIIPVVWSLYSKLFSLNFKLCFLKFKDHSLNFKLYTLNFKLYFLSFINILWNLRFIFFFKKKNLNIKD